MYPLSNKGINEMNELDCLRALVLQGGVPVLTNKGINELNELDCLRILVLRPSGAGLDPNASAIIAAIIAAGVTPTGPQQTAINDFVVALKAGSLWTPMNVMYGFVGATAATHAINWKNPGTNNITWHGTPTQDANGVTGNFTDAWGDTGLLDNSLTQTSKSFGVYCRTNANDACPQIDIGSGGANGSGLHVRFSDGNGYFANPGSSLITVPALNGLGLLTSSRTSNILHTGYRNATSVGTDTSAAGSGVADTWKIIGLPGIAFSGWNECFAYVASGLTQQNITDLHAAVQALQTSLGRQV